MVFWNSLEVSEPPTNTCKVSSSTFLTKDILKFNDVLTSSISVLNKLDQLHYEAAVLSRVLYKHKRRFRHDKGFIKLEKVNRGLLKYLACDLVSVYTKFARMSPEHSKDFEVDLPTRQMLEWVLVRTQGFAKLFCHIIDSCEESFSFWMARLRKTDMAPLSLIFIAVISRIWAYSRYLVKNSCVWFSELRPYLQILQPRGIAWLPEDYEIPENLKVWLNLPEVTETSRKIVSNLERSTADMYNIHSFVDLEQGGDIKDEFSSSNKHTIPLVHDSAIEDFGEVISRHDLSRALSHCNQTNTGRPEEGKYVRLPLDNTSSNNHVISSRKKRKLEEIHLSSDECSPTTVKVRKKNRKSMCYQPTLKLQGTGTVIGSQSAGGSSIEGKRSKKKRKETEMGGRDHFKHSRIIPIVNESKKKMDVAANFQPNHLTKSHLTIMAKKKKKDRNVGKHLDLKQSVTEHMSKTIVLSKGEMDIPTQKKKKKKLQQVILANNIISSEFDKSASINTKPLSRNQRRRKRRKLDGVLE